MSSGVVTSRDVVGELTEAVLAQSQRLGALGADQIEDRVLAGPLKRISSTLS
jgi:hypothetical protein